MTDTWEVTWTRDVQGDRYYWPDSVYSNSRLFFSVQSGQLPAGLTLASSQFLWQPTITGTPTEAGTFPLQVHVHAEGQDYEADVEIIVRVLRQDKVVALDGYTAPIGSGYSFVRQLDLNVETVNLPHALSIPEATGEVHWSLFAGALPAGMTFENGVFSGTPTEFSFPFEGTERWLIVEGTDDDSVSQVQVRIQIYSISAEVASVTPAPGAVDVPPNTWVTVEFRLVSSAYSTLWIDHIEVAEGEDDLLDMYGASRPGWEVEFDAHAAAGGGYTYTAAAGRIEDGIENWGDPGFTDHPEWPATADGYHHITLRFRPIDGWTAGHTYSASEIGHTYALRSAYDKGEVTIGATFYDLVHFTVAADDASASWAWCEGEDTTRGGRQVLITAAAVLNELTALAGTSGAPSGWSGGRRTPKGLALPKGVAVGPSDARASFWLRVGANLGRGTLNLQAGAWTVEVTTATARFGSQPKKRPRPGAHVVVELARIAGQQVAAFVDGALIAVLPDDGSETPVSLSVSGSEDVRVERWEVLAVASINDRLVTEPEIHFDCQLVGRVPAAALAEAGVARVALYPPSGEATAVNGLFVYRAPPRRTILQRGDTALYTVQDPSLRDR